MSLLQKLSTFYVLCAMLFSVSFVLDRNPQLAHAARSAVRTTLEAARDDLARPAVELVRRGTNVAVAQIARPVSMPSATSQFKVPRRQLAASVPRSMPPPRLKSNTNEAARISLRVKENLTHEMMKNFGLFLYVSKAEQGPWAQHLYVLRKNAAGDLDLLYSWSASTGREKSEVAPNGTRQRSTTPSGYYQLDPLRMYRRHFSGQWHEPMPYAMFFNWEKRGFQTGLAIHAATRGELSQLGTRASAGCIRIAPENARLLFHLIRSEYKGPSPRFAFDRRTATMSNDGVFMHDAAGNLRYTNGYKVLVLIENYGGKDTVATLF